MTKLKYIGIYEIFSGLVGIIFMLISLDFTSTIKILFSIFSILLFSMVALSGILMYSKKQVGIYLSIIVQAIQVLNFNIAGYKYIFCSGTKLSISMANDLEIDFAAILTEFIIGINTISNTFITINLIPMFLIGILYSNRN